MLANYFQIQMREQLTLTILLALAELVIQSVGDCNCDAGNYLITHFLPKFTDTEHIRWVLSVCKFVSYSALWHTRESAQKSE